MASTAELTESVETGGDGSKGWLAGGDGTALSIESETVGAGAGTLDEGSVTACGGSDATACGGLEEARGAAIALGGSEVGGAVTACGESEARGVTTASGGWDAAITGAGEDTGACSLASSLGAGDAAEDAGVKGTAFASTMLGAGGIETELGVPIAEDTAAGVVGAAAGCSAGDGTEDDSTRGGGDGGGGGGDGGGGG